MRLRRPLPLLATVLAGFLTLAACGGASDFSTLTDQLGSGVVDAPSDRAGTLIGSQSTPCPSVFDIAPGDTGLCRLRAGDSTAATVTVTLQAASEAGKTRIIYLCDYTKVKTVTTYRRDANLNWETLSTDYNNNPQCSTGKALQLRFDPNNYYPYLYQPNVVAARNRDIQIRIPSCDEAYGWLCPFYNNPSIGVIVYDYDPNNVTPTIPGV